MLISRCAWHRRYYGHALWNGVSSWRGLNLKFTDGICKRCLVRFRAEHSRLLERDERRVRRRVPAAESVA